MMEIQEELGGPKRAISHDIGEREHSSSVSIKRESSPTQPINGQQTIVPMISGDENNDLNGADQMIEPPPVMDHQSIGVKELKASVCAGCSQTIRDKFIFSVIDLHWHQDCVQCCDCSLKLSERCFTFNGKLYCKHHYWHRFGPKCYACNEPINKGELVQRIKGNRVYHLKCFTCNQCNKRLEQGEQLHLIEDKRLLCKQDFQQLTTTAAAASQQKQTNGSSNSNSGGKSSNQQQTKRASAGALASATDNNNKFQAIIHSNNNSNSGNNGFSKREHPLSSEQQQQQQFNCSSTTAPKAATLSATNSPYLTLLSPSANHQPLDQHQLRASGPPSAAKSKRTSLTSLDNTMAARRQINDQDDDDDDGDDDDDDDDVNDDDRDIGLDDRGHLNADEQIGSDTADDVYCQLDELDDDEDQEQDEEDNDDDDDNSEHAIDSKSLSRRRRSRTRRSSAVFDYSNELASASAASNLDTENVENRTAASGSTGPDQSGQGKLTRSASMSGSNAGAANKRKRRRKRDSAKSKDGGGSIKTGATSKAARGNGGESILNGGSGNGQSASILASMQQGAQSQQQQQQQLLKSNCSNSSSSSSSSNSSNHSASSTTDSPAGSASLVQRARAGQQQQQQLSHHRQSNHHHSGSHHNHSLHHSQSTGGGGGGGGGGKPTRVRTVLNEKQLQTLRDCYSHNPRPDALMKEQLVNMTGLSPRVIRVWFQNKRCKDKKKSILYKQMQQHEKDGRHLVGLTHIRGVPMVASSPIQYHEELSSGAMAAGGTNPCSPNQRQPLSSVQSPTTHAAACNQQQQQPSPAIDIHAYQPPWKGLVDYAQQSQAAQQAPGSTNKASPNHHHQQQQPDRLDASSPRYVQLIGQIHGYGNNQIEQLTAPDNSHQVIELHPPQAPPAPQPPQSSGSSGSSNNNNNNGNSIANQLTARPQYSPGAIVQQQQQQSGPLMSPQLYPHQHPHPAHTAASLMHPPPPQHLHHAHHHLTVQQQQQVSGPPPPPLGHHMHQFQQQH